MTARIITKESIVNVMAHISKAEQEGIVSHCKAQPFMAFVLFGAFTDERTITTMIKLTVAQFRDALRLDYLLYMLNHSKIKLECRIMFLCIHK